MEVIGHLQASDMSFPRELLLVIIEKKKTKNKRLGAAK
jgi:hypothetical protein